MSRPSKPRRSGEKDTADDLPPSATSVESGEVWRQHVVSEVLLRRWAVDGMLTEVNLTFSRVSTKSPRAVGFVKWFVRRDYSKPVEDTWKQVEDKLPAAFRSVDEGRAFDDVAVVATLRELLAMHVVRARHTELLWADALVANADEGDLADALAMANDPQVLGALYKAQTGLHPVNEDQLLQARHRLLEELDSDLGMGAARFATELLKQYKNAVRQVREMEIGVATDGEFLVSDNPAATYDSERGVVGVYRGAKLDNADTFVLPLGPRHLLAAGGGNSYVDFSGVAVENANRLQLASAVERIFVQPGSGLEEWVLGNLPE